LKSHINNKKPRGKEEVVFDSKRVLTEETRQRQRQRQIRGRGKNRIAKIT